MDPRQIQGRLHPCARKIQASCRVTLLAQVDYHYLSHEVPVLEQNTYSSFTVWSNLSGSVPDGNSCLCLSPGSHRYGFVHWQLLVPSLLCFVVSTCFFAGRLVVAP